MKEARLKRQGKRARTKEGKTREGKAKDSERKRKRDIRKNILIHSLVVGCRLNVGILENRLLCMGERT